MAYYFPMLFIAALIVGAAVLMALLPNIVAALPRRSFRSKGHHVRRDGEAPPPPIPSTSPRFRFWRPRRR
jgi:hypothetical protein